MADPRETRTRINILQPGDIILSRDSGLVDGLNRLLQSLARGHFGLSPFSHAAVCTSPGTVIDADIFKPLGTRALDAWLKGVSYDDAFVFRRPAGIRAEDITTAVDLEKAAIKTDLDAEARTAGGTNFEIAHMARYFAGRKYNWFFLRGKGEHQSRRSFFCSELVASVLARVQPDALSRPPEKILPLDLPEIFRRAGWEEFRLRELYVLARASPTPLPADNELSPVVRDFLSQHPDLKARLDAVRGAPDLLDELKKITEDAAKHERHMEQTHIQLATNTKLLMENILRYQNRLIEELQKADGLHAKREVLTIADMPIDIREIPAVMDWLRHALKQAGTQNQIHEYMDDAAKLEGAVIARKVLMESIRARLLLLDIKRINERFAAIVSQALLLEGEAERLRFTNQEITPLVDAYPYLAETDKTFQANFETKLMQCADALKAAVGALKAAGVNEQLARMQSSASELLEWYDQMRAVFPVLNYFPSARDPPSLQK
jgi:hypothetical protein